MLFGGSGARRLLVAVVVVPWLLRGAAASVPCICSSNCSFTESAEDSTVDLGQLRHDAYHSCPEWGAAPHPHAYEVVLAPAFVLGSGAFMRQLLMVTGLPVPYTVNLLLLGGGLGLLLQYLAVQPLEAAVDGECEQPWLWEGVLQYSLTTMAGLDPHLLLHIFIPPLIFESAFAIDWHVFFQLKWATLLLAVPGVVGSTFALGGVINALYGSQGADTDELAWPSNAGLLLGVILSATDPVAVVALLKELGVKEELSIGIEGESLLNDGTALVFFQVLVDLVRVPAVAAPTANTFIFQVCHLPM